MPLCRVPQPMISTRSQGVTSHFFRRSIPYDEPCSVQYRCLHRSSLHAWQAGYSTRTTIKLVIRLSTTPATTCAVFALDLADKNGVVGQITIDNDPISGTPAVVAIASSGSDVSGKCVLDTTASAKTFSVTTAMTSAAKGNAFDLGWQYAQVPPNGAVSWEFQASG